jgi:hypothetical protein
VVVEVGAIPSAADPGRAEQTRARATRSFVQQALHLVTLALARSTMCGSAAHGMVQVAAQVVGGFGYYFSASATKTPTPGRPTKTPRSANSNRARLTVDWATS